MVIKEILAQVETTTHPVAKAIHKGEHFKVLAIAFKSGMVLKDHKSHLPAKLTVLSGSVRYHDAQNEVVLNTHDEIEIPVNETHRVDALQDSLCLLTQG